MVNGMPCFFSLKGEKLGLDGEKAESTYDVVNLKVNPTQMDKLLKMDGVFPSYHMSKKTWVSLVLDETLPDQTVFELLSESRSLVAPKHLRKSFGASLLDYPGKFEILRYWDEFSANEEILWTQKASMQKGDLWLSILRHLPRPSVRLSGFRGKYPNQGYREEESIKELMRIKPLYTLTTLTLIVID